MPLSEINQPFITRLLHWVLHSKRNAAWWGGVGEKKRKKKHLLHAVTRRVILPVGPFNVYFNWIWYAQRFISTEKNTAAWLLFGSYVQFSWITQSAISYVKHTRIDRATVNFPAFWIYSIHRAELVLSGETEHPDKKKIITAYNPVGRKITKQSFSLTPSSVRQCIERASTKTLGHALPSSILP